MIPSEVVLAYVDPGSGIMAVQLFWSAVVGSIGFVTYRGWGWISRVILRRKPKNEANDTK